MGIFDTEAIVLRTYKLAEADKIVVCLTRETGLVRGVARGARRLKSRYGASLEPWTYIALNYYEKEGRDLVTLRQVEILRSYFAMATRSTEALAALEYLSELLIEFAPPHEPFEKLFRMAKACIETIAETGNDSTAVRAAVQYFEVWTLKLAGVFPDLRSCADCRRRFGEEEAAVRLSVENRVRCAECATSSEPSLASATYAQLRAIERSAPSDFVQRTTVRDAQQEIAALTQRLIARALERVPRGQAGFTRHSV